MKIVRHITANLTHYRVPFFQKARSLLLEKGIDYSVLYGQPTRIETTRLDLSELDWGISFENIYLDKSGRKLVWQPILKDCLKTDLIIVSQENRLLLNYVLQCTRLFFGPGLALWGHGKNFQSQKPFGLAEQWKKWWSTRCDWWFAYTEETARILIGNGFDPSRITVFNNSIDVRDLKKKSEETTAEHLAAVKRELGLTNSVAGIFVGGLYPEKRLDFLIESARLIKSDIPNFCLLIIGAGPDLERVVAASQNHPWIKVLGPKFGREKVEIMMCAQLFLMPGLVGLAVLDAAALGLPLVTTAFPYHSPEIAYIENDVSGVIVKEWSSSQAYANAVTALLQNNARLKSMSRAGAHISERYGIDEMARRYADGVVKALEASKH